MNSESTYHLMARFIEIETKKFRGGYDEEEFVDILLLLEKKCNIKLGRNVSDWVSWFIEEGASSEQNKKSIKIMWKLLEIEKISKIKMRDKL